MSVVNIASRNLEADHDHLAELAVSLSRRLTRVMVDNMPAAIAEALAEVAAAVRADGCRLLEFSDSSDNAKVHAPTGATLTADSVQAPEAWLVDRLRRGELVSISRPEDLPQELLMSREEAQRPRPYSSRAASIRAAS